MSLIDPSSTPSDPTDTCFPSVEPVSTSENLVWCQNKKPSSTFPLLRPQSSQSLRRTCPKTTIGLRPVDIPARFPQCTPQASQISSSRLKLCKAYWPTLASCSCECAPNKVSDLQKLDIPNPWVNASISRPHASLYPLTQYCVHRGLGTLRRISHE
jgi:hypothetical protein